MNKATLLKTLGNVPGVSHALRWMASRFPEGSVVPIRSGYAQGMLWKRSHRYVNGYWLGHFELEIQAAIARILSPGDFFLDVGANAGLLSLVALRKIGPHGKCVSLDPDPANCQNMAELARLNALTNWVIVQKAAAESPGKLRFATASAGNPTGHLAREGESANTFDVDVTTVDEISREHGAPRLVKVDVEGAEVRVLRGAAQTLREMRPALLIELHAPDLASAARDLLHDAGYRFYELSGQPIPDSTPLPHHVVAQTGKGRIATDENR
jgi:FkbM family methyltransferase